MNQLLEFLKVQDWYALAIFIVPLLVQVIKRPGLWDRVPARLQPLVPVAVAFVGGVDVALIQGQPLGEAAKQGVSAAVVVGLGAIGVYEAWWRTKNGARTSALVVLLFLGAPSLSGCAVSLESARAARAPQTGSAARDSARCQTLDDRRTVWGTVSTGAIVLSGSSGLSTIPVEDRDFEVALAAGAVGLATVAAVAQYVEQSSTESWARECQ